MSEASKDILMKLAEVLPEDKINIKPGVFSKDKSNVMVLSFL